MSVKRVVPNIGTNHMAESRAFYTDFLGMELAMDMGWIVTLISPDHPQAQISLLQQQKPISADVDLSLTIEVPDVEVVHDKAERLGLPIVYPLTTESWSVRRFHVLDPNGVVLNVMSHMEKVV